MFGLCNKFLGRNIIRVLPDYTKIKNIISSLPYNSTSYSQIDIDSSLLFHSFNLPSIDNLIHRLINSTKSVSIDDILPLTLLHKISICCDLYLLNIISDSFASSIFPTYLKTAVIRLILKKAGLEKNNLNNYRLIAQLSVFSKIIERVVTKQIMQHLIH